MKKSLKASQTKDCALCNVQESHILVSEKDIIVSASPLGVRPGHLVVATRKHVESFSELTADEMHNLMTMLGHALISAEEAGHNVRYYVLRIGDKSPHLHFHLIPRSTDDKGLGAFIFGDSGWVTTLVRSRTAKDIELFASRFKRSFGSQGE